MFLIIQLTISQHWFRHWLGTRRWAIVWTNDHLVYWHIYMWLGLNELTTLSARTIYFGLICNLWPFLNISTRAGTSTRFTSVSTSMSTCNMCEYEYKYEYLIITWVWVRVQADEYEHECKHRSMIYILFKQQYCIFQSLKRESSDFHKPGTKLQLPIAHVNSL